MMSYEPARWRTDLVVFINNHSALFNRTDFFLNELNCTFANVREASSEAPPMCTLVAYTPLKMRNLTSQREFINSGEKYRHILNEIDIFSDSPSDLAEFYALTHSHLARYSYTDSIMMAFEGYGYLRRS